MFSANSFALRLENPFLLPSHRFLGCKEFNSDGDWKLKIAAPVKDEAPQFEIATHHWRFASRCIDAAYPNWRQVVPDGSGTQTTVNIDATAAELLMQTMARLPDHDRIHHGIGLELTRRRAALLARSEDGPPTRIEVEGVTVRRKDVTVCLNRNLLAKALRFRLLHIDIMDALGPLRFSEGGRQMIVMPVRPDLGPAPAHTTPRPAPLPAAANPNPPPLAEQPENKTTMPDTNGTTTTNGASHTTVEKPAIETALAQIETIKGSYREAIRGLNGLADLLKQAQRESKSTEKEISSVRQTLRSLQSVRI